MSFVEQFQLVERLHTLIKKKGTGSPKELAIRLNISRASVFRQISILKNLGAKISYCKRRGSYIYDEKFSIFFQESQ